MKKTFTKQLLCLLAILPFVFSSCSDDDSEPVPAFSCQINRISFVNNGVEDGSFTQFTYNNLGYLQKMEQKEGLGNQSKTVYVRNYTYNAENQVTRIDYSEDSGNNEGYSVYEYNTTGTINKVSDFNKNNTLKSDQIFTYDANNRNTQVITNRNGAISRTVYEYVGTSENISKRIEYGPNNVLMGTYTYENYDDKQNPAFSIMGFPIIGESKNNPKKMTETSSSLPAPRVTDYTYTYNSRGLVTEIAQNQTASAERKSRFTYNNCD